MKRINNLYSKICSIENLELADKKASKGKAKQPGVIDHERNRAANIEKLHEMLKGKTYRTSEYTTFTIYEPKERLIFRLPYYPDRITHHAIMNVLESVFVASFTANTYSCIKKRGIHAAANAVKRALNDVENTQYCLKLDIRKFYPSVDHVILKQLLRRKIKDNDLLWLLDEIIDSTEGLPIGNYLSQYLANYYLSYFDHWLKENKRIRYYFRYADDIVILASNKPELHQILADIKEYFAKRLNLEVKHNYQIFPTDARGIDFVGYVFRHTHTRLRKSIKQDFARMLAKNPNAQSIASYAGWAVHCNSINLLNKLMNSFSQFNIKTNTRGFEGDKIKISKILNREIAVHHFKIEDSKLFKDKGSGKCLHLQISLGDKMHIVFTSSSCLIEAIMQVPENGFPFSTTIVEENDRYKFT
jgi:RNA-directed DNA polymerase